MLLLYHPQSKSHCSIWKDTAQSNDSEVASGEICCWRQCILIPLSGVEKDDPSNDAFNFYLSQMRIHIEQTFGLMTGKWRNLCQPLHTCLKNFGRVFVCIRRLHKFCINEGITSVNIIEDNEGGDSVFMYSDVHETSIVGSSMLRDIILQ